MNGVDCWMDEKDFKIISEIFKINKNFNVSKFDFVY